MPVISMWKDEAEFVWEQRKEGKVEAHFMFFISLGMYTCHKVNDSKPTHNPLREDDNLGLCTWNSEDKCWKPTLEEINHTYRNWKAEQALLG